MKDYFIYTSFQTIDDYVYIQTVSFLKANWFKKIKNTKTIKTDINENNIKRTNFNNLTAKFWKYMSDINQHDI